MATKQKSNQEQDSSVRQKNLYELSYLDLPADLQEFYFTLFGSQLIPITATIKKSGPPFKHVLADLWLHRVGHDKAKKIVDDFWRWCEINIKKEGSAQSIMPLTWLFQNQLLSPDEIFNVFSLFQVNGWLTSIKINDTTFNLLDLNGIPRDIDPFDAASWLEGSSVYDDSLTQERHFSRMGPIFMAPWWKPMLKNFTQLSLLYTETKEKVKSDKIQHKKQQNDLLLEKVKQEIANASKKARPTSSVDIQKLDQFIKEEMSDTHNFIEFIEWLKKRFSPQLKKIMASQGIDERELLIYQGINQEDLLERIRLWEIITEDLKENLTEPQQKEIKNKILSCLSWLPTLSTLPDGYPVENVLSHMFDLLKDKKSSLHFLINYATNNYFLNVQDITGNILNKPLSLSNLSEKTKSQLWLFLAQEKQNDYAQKMTYQNVSRYIKLSHNDKQFSEIENKKNIINDVFLHDLEEFNQKIWLSDIVSDSLNMRSSLSKKEQSLATKKPLIKEKSSSELSVYRGTLNQSFMFKNVADSAHFMLCDIDQNGVGIEHVTRANFEKKQSENKEKSKKILDIFSGLPMAFISFEELTHLLLLKEKMLKSNKKHTMCVEYLNRCIEKKVADIGAYMYDVFADLSRDKKGVRANVDILIKNIQLLFQDHAEVWGLYPDISSKIFADISSSISRCLIDCMSSAAFSEEKQMYKFNNLASAINLADQCFKIVVPHQDPNHIQTWGDLHQKNPSPEVFKKISNFDMFEGLTCEYSSRRKYKDLSHKASTWWSKQLSDNANRDGSVQKNAISLFIKAIKNTDLVILQSLFNAQLQMIAPKCPPLPISGKIHGYTITPQVKKNLEKNLKESLEELSYYVTPKYSEEIVDVAKNAHQSWISNLEKLSLQNELSEIVNDKQNNSMSLGLSTPSKLKRKM